jgi:hypothetical protein
VHRAAWRISAVKWQHPAYRRAFRGMARGDPRLRRPTLTGGPILSTAPVTVHARSFGRAGDRGPLPLRAVVQLLRDKHQPLDNRGLALHRN